MLMTVLEPLSGEPVVYRAIKDLARTGDLKKAKRSWASLKRQFAYLRDDPSWRKPLETADMILRSGEWMSEYGIDAIAKSLPSHLSGEQSMAYLASQCVDDAVCGVWQHADASTLVGILAALGARRALAGGLATIGMSLLRQTKTDASLEVVMVLEQTIRWAEYKGPEPERVDPIWRWRGNYLTSGVAYTAWVPFAKMGYQGREVDLAGAGYTALDSYSRVLAITEEDPGGWKHQPQQKAELANVMRAAVKCPSVRDAIDGAYSD